MAPSSARVVATAAVLAGIAACRAPDPYYRHGVLPDASSEPDDASNVPETGPLADGSSACPSCLVTVSYTCRTGEGLAPQASFVLDVINRPDSPTIELADLTLRYWYTLSPRKEQALDCDFARLGCTNLVTSMNPPPAPQPRFEDVLPPRVRANHYVEIAFLRGAFALDPGLETGDIQLRLHNKDLSNIDQTDDYSFDCATPGMAFPSSAITAYVRGVLVWGREPR